MDRRSDQPGGRRLRWLAGSAALAAMLAAVGAGAWYCFGRTVWVDVAAAPQGAADSRVRRTLWTAPRYVGPVAPAAGGAAASQHAPALAPDGKTRYFVWSVAGTGADIFVSRLAGGVWGPAQPLTAANSDCDDLCPSVSPDGDWLYFASNRPGGQGGLDLYRCRLWPDGGCGPAENLGATINSPANEKDPHVTAAAAAGATGGAGRPRLNFATDRVGGAGTYDLMSSQMREVCAVRVGFAPPHLAAEHWVGIAVLLIVVPLGVMLRLAGYRPLDLQGKCVLLSIVVHGTVVLVLGSVFVYKPLFHFVGRHDEETSTTLTMANWDEEVPAPMSVGSAEVPASALPAPDAAAVGLPRQDVAPIAPPAAQATELPAPPAAVALPPMAAEPALPRPAAPLPAPERPRPPAVAALGEAPAVHMPEAAPVVAAAEARPLGPGELPAPAAAAAPVRLPSPAPGGAAPVELALPAAPARVAGEGLAQPPAIAPPPVPLALPAAIAAAPALPAALAPQAPEVAAPTVAAVGPPAGPDPVAAAYGYGGPAVDSVKFPTSAPAAKFPPGRGAASGSMALAVPAARLAGGPGSSRAMPAAIARMAPSGGAAEALVPRVALGLAAAAAGGAPEINMSGLGLPAAPAGAPLPETYAQRSVEGRAKLVEALGGSKESEAAVQRGLAYLAGIQGKDGFWLLDSAALAGLRPRNDPALTGLVSLSFLAGGHAPGTAGPYGPQVKLAIDALIRRQRDDGGLRGNGGDMYSHAIATLAVAEAAGMTNDPTYRAAAVKAAGFILKSQNRATGGWRYTPGDPGDTSVFGWQIMALRSVESAGVKIPAETRDLASRWLASVSRSPRGMLVGYRDANPTPRMTAEALASRLFLGQQLTDAQLQEACDYLQFTAGTEAGGKAVSADYYYWYYGSLALDQLQNDAWRKWNEQVQPMLRKLQRPDGSWEPDSTYYGSRGGKTYVTALATLTLEVYYRYLPMRQQKAAGGR